MVTGLGTIVELSERMRNRHELVIDSIISFHELEKALSTDVLGDKNAREVLSDSYRPRNVYYLLYVFEGLELSLHGSGWIVVLLPAGLFCIELGHYLVVLV